MSLTFAETHNMVSYLKKSDASEGFNQVIDFLNGSYIKYALIVNPNIYVSFIKQFWNNVAIKQVNDVTRLQALVDKKKVVVTEAAIREVLRLDDAEGWKFLIHTILKLMSAKRTSWNEFSSAITSAVICLSTGDLSTHTTKYTSPALTQKVFANMRRVGKGFSEVETPLFKGMLVGQVIEEGGDAEEHVKDVTDDDATQGDDTDAYGEVLTKVEHLEYDKVAQALEITRLKRRMKKLEKGNRVKVLKLRRLKRVGTSQRVDTSEDTVMDDESNQGRIINEMDKDDDVALMDDKEEDKKEEEAKAVEDDQVHGRQAESQAEIYKIDLDHASKVLSMQEDKPAEVLEVVDVVTTAKRRKGVVIMDPQEDSTTSPILPAETKSKDKGKRIMVEEPKPLKKKQQVEMDEEYARKLHAELNKDIDWDVAIDHVKQKAKEDLAVQRYQGMKKKPQTEAQKNMIIQKSIWKEEESRALQSINETPTQKAAKRRKLNKEVEDLKRHLEIVLDEDDDVYTEATPLERKVPVVDYEIINLNNKPYYKII
nr:hypothetical protein [Tanacetum cinerariifolium]